MRCPVCGKSIQTRARWLRHAKAAGHHFKTVTPGHKHSAQCVASPAALAVCRAADEVNTNRALLARVEG